MTRQILFRNSKHYSLAVAVAMAKRQYLQAEHTQGWPAQEVHFHPSEQPAETSIAGLTVCASEDVRPGHLRIVSQFVNEYEAAGHPGLAA